MINEKADGGLGLGSIKNQNLALLAKCGWRFMTGHDALWRKVVISIHGFSEYGWFTAGIHPLSLKSSWMYISKVWQQSSTFIKLKLGNGLNIYFWNHLWADISNLKSQFPQLYLISCIKKGSVTDFWDSQTESWNLEFRRLLKDDKGLAFSALLGLISRHKVTSVEDKGVWILDQFRGNSLLNP